MPKCHLGQPSVRRHDEAVSLFKKAIASDPTMYEAYNNLGGELLSLGRTAEAVAVPKLCAHISRNIFLSCFMGSSSCYKTLGRV